LDNHPAIFYGSESESFILSQMTSEITQGEMDLKVVPLVVQKFKKWSMEVLAAPALKWATGMHMVWTYIVWIISMMSQRAYRAWNCLWVE
jgi:hypothetical protein